MLLSADQLASLFGRGFVVVPGVLSGAEAGRLAARVRSDPEKETGHHSETMWRVRSHPKVEGLFRSLWREEDLLVSFDGVGFRERGGSFVLPWHVDQNGGHGAGMACAQGAIALLPQREETGGLEVVDGSHLEHASWVERGEEGEWEYYEAPPRAVRGRASTFVRLEVGDAVLWDSRLVHRVVPPTDPTTERMVAYVCFTPKAWASAGTLRTRKWAFEHDVGTTHWPHVCVLREEGRAEGRVRCAREFEHARLVS